MPRATPEGAPPGSLPCKPIDGGLRIFIRLTPKSQTDGIKGLFAGPDGPRLDLKVRALPEDGAANDATVRLLARLFGVPRATVSLAQGATSRYKAFDFMGDDRRLSAKLADLLANQDG